MIVAKPPAASDYSLMALDFLKDKENGRNRIKMVLIITKSINYYYSHCA